MTNRLPTWLVLVLLCYALRRWHKACVAWDEPQIPAAFVRAFDGVKA